MSSTKTKPSDDIKVSKTNNPISPLVIGLLFSTYFLTVQTIEYSLSSYVLNENKSELYRKYLLFKSDAPVWKWWLLLTLVTLPLTIFESCSNLLKVFTTRDSMKRHLTSIIRAIQLFSLLFITFTRAIPLEKKLMEKSSRETLIELNYYQLGLLLLNIIAWFIPIIQYKQAQDIEPIHKEKKEQ